MKYLFYRRFYLSLLLLAFSTAASAQTPAAAAAPVPAEKQVTEFDVNGLKVLIKRRPGTPTVAAGLFVRGGSRNLTKENAGIENLTLDTAVEGSKNFPRQVLRKELSKTASSITAGSNPDYSAFSMISTKENFDRSWQIFTDITLNPSFLPEDIEPVRQRLLLGLRSRTDLPESQLEIEQDKIIYADHPYANDQYGTIENVTRFKPADLMAYHKQMMQTSRLLLVVVGDIEPAALQKQITESYGKLPRGDYKETALPGLAFTTPTVDITTRTLPTNYVKGVFPGPNVGDPDYYAMRVAVTLLQSRVFQEVRVKRNLSYAPNAELGSLGSNTGFISVSSTNANEAVKIMLEEIEKLKRVPIPGEFSVGLGSYFLTTYYQKQETNAAQAGELASYELNGGGWRNSLGFLDKMRAVTPADVMRVANKYMKNIRFVVVGNPADVNKQIFLNGQPPERSDRH